MTKSDLVRVAVFDGKQIRKIMHEGVSGGFRSLIL